MKVTISVKSQKVRFLTGIFFLLLIHTSNIDASDKILIFPIPQQMQITAEVFIPDETMSVIVPEKMSRNDIFLARFLVRELSDKYGIAIKIESRNDIPKDRKVIVMGRFDNTLD